MDLGLEALTRASANGRTEHRPDFFKLSLPGERERLEDLLKREPGIRVHDELQSQLRELVRALHPAIRFTRSDLDKAATTHLKDTPAEEYGVWVHYPWSGRLIHLLDKEEFALVRTDRNRNKITREEQATLATKKVGVIGLSVGQSASLVLAQERAFGELRLADFDTLDLSNLNRIRSGVHLLGLNKAVNTAREIAEIDPFLKVSVFMEGITEENIDGFLTDGGPLDLLIEECDSVAVKIKARQRARALRIPVVMDTSDRGLIDVERFDLEPERPVLHGLVEHLDLDLAAQAVTNEEKLPFVIPIAGLGTMSARMKASMLEIENSITTWPQLASGVVLGGAVVGHVARRILLGQAMPSGRWWLDPDDHFGVDEQRKAARPVGISLPEALTGSRMEALAERVCEQGWQGGVSSEQARALAQAGSLAPSGGNCQPWKFLHHSGCLFVFMDKQRATSALDPGWRYAMLSMGTCVENIMIRAAHEHIPARVTTAPLPDADELVAVISADGQPELLTATSAGLAEVIGLRCTNRKRSTTQVLSDAEYAALMEVAMQRPEYPVNIVRDPQRIALIARACGQAERLRFLNPACHHDMFDREMRWDTTEAERTRDGIDIATLEMRLPDRTGMRVAADPNVASLLAQWNGAHGIEKLTVSGIEASSALVVVSSPDLSLSSAFSTGRAIQSLWLKATSLGLLTHPISAPIFMGLHGLWDEAGLLSEAEHRTASRILDEFRTVLGEGPGHPLFMFRVGRADGPTARSLRLPLAQLFSTTANQTTVA